VDKILTDIVRRAVRLRSQSFLHIKTMDSIASSDSIDNTRQTRQEAQLSPCDCAMRLVSSNLANYHATVQKLINIFRIETTYTTSPDQTDGMKLEV